MSDNNFNLDINNEDVRLSAKDLEGVAGGTGSCVRCCKCGMLLPVCYAFENEDGIAVHSGCGGTIEFI